MSLRMPAVAGTFYPARPEELRRMLVGMIAAGSRVRALAVVAPHAGYPYSGKVAGAVYGGVKIPREVVILCFHHRREGSDFGIWPAGDWKTPLGDVPVAGDLGRRIREAFPEASFDEAGHQEEHSGEVQVPFLRHLRPDVRIVPVALNVGLDDRSFERLRAFGRALAGVKGDFLVVASTDLDHDEDQETTVRKDQAVIREIERLDEEGLRRAVRRCGFSMCCGAAPVIAAIAYAKAKGGTAARTVAHATSGDVSGDFERVVGYVGMIVPCGN